MSAKIAAHDPREQQHLPGQEPVKNDRVHRAAKRYAKLRDERMAANEEEKAAHNTLLGIMKEEGLEVYEYGDLTVAIDAQEKCKVRFAPRKTEENGDE